MSALTLTERAQRVRLSPWQRQYLTGRTAGWPASRLRNVRWTLTDAGVLAKREGTTLYELTDLGRLVQDHLAP